MERYYWSKGVLKNNLEIVYGTERIGSIVWESLIGSKAHGMLNNRRFILNREFFLSKLEIYDANTEALLGTIMVNLFNPRSEIVINGKRFELEVKNFWQSRWSWKFNGDELITYQSNEFLSKDRGTIEVFVANTEETEILLLLGLFVRNQFILFMLMLFILLLIIIF
ncbi:MAG TPA: hypothetical protein PKO30_14180 [Prolixibacteraceae bacterium]|jgi:hypothetical protein|nr:hypothetical protein [Prolixibacteraceae bacterium]